MECKCGGQIEVTLVEAVALLKCLSCGRGEHIPQAKPQEVFEFRARVGQAMGGSCGADRGEFKAPGNA